MIAEYGTTSIFHIPGHVVMCLSRRYPVLVIE